MTPSEEGPEAGSGVTPSEGATAKPGAEPADASSILKSRSYLVILLLGALIGVPVSAVAFGFLELVHAVQVGVYGKLPGGLGFHGEPPWWPVPLLFISGLLVAAAIRFLPGRAGHSPADGFSAGITQPAALPGVALAALATLALGAVLGPEAPLIAIGSGLGLLAVRSLRKGTPAMGQTVVAAAGSFAALGTILGSPLLAAIFMMEAIGLGGPLLSLVILPGLLAAGVGSLVFIGLGSWTGVGTFSLALPNLPYLARPNLSELGWAAVIGVVAALVAIGLHWLAVWVRTRVEPRLLIATPVVGLAVGGLAVLFAEVTGKPSSDLLFSGQTLIGSLVAHSASWALSALLLLVLLKAVAYGLSLSSFRGGPIFPSLLLGAAGGVAASHLPGVGLVPGVAMGMGAMCAAMLRLPVVSVALPTVLLFHDGTSVAPIVIVAVVVSFVTISWLSPRPASSLVAPTTSPATAPA